MYCIFGSVDFVSQIVFFSGAIGAFNSLLVAVYLLLSKTFSKIQNKIFGIFLLVLSLRVIKSLFYAFSSEEPIWFLQSGPSFFLLIGPLFFTYIVCMVNFNSFWAKNKNYHISFWMLIITLIYIFLPFRDFNDLNKEVLLPIINLQWLFYILIAGIYLNISFGKIAKQHIIQKWLLLLVLSNLVIWMSFALVEFRYFVTGSLIYSLLFYLFCLFFLLKKKITSQIFVKNKVSKKVDPSEETKILIDTLETYFSKEKPYLNPNLKITDLAQKLSIPSHQLSKIFNENLDISFSEYVNKFRIEEAKKLIREHSNFTIEAIGNQSGFNSKSAFYKAFRAYTGTTPAKLGS